MDPGLALPSYRVYRGSLAALLIGSVFAIWLLVLPQAGADRDSPPSSLAGVLPTRAAGAATPGSTTTPSPTATTAPATATATPAGTPVPATEPPAATATATATPAPTPTPTPTVSPTEPVAYTVQPGDTLYGIAARFLPAGRDLDQFTKEIQTLNQITDPGSLGIGSVIQIPRQ